MSLLHVIDDVIKVCKAEESRLTESIRQYKQLLHSMRTRVTDISDTKPAAAVSTTDDAPPEERQEIKLLDQVLKKALRIRSASEAHKELSSDIKTRPDRSRNKSPVSDAVKGEDEREPVKCESGRKLSHRVRSAGGSGIRGEMWTRPVGFRKGSTARPAVRGQQSVPVKISSTASQQKISVKTTTAEDSSEEHSTSMSCQTHCREDQTSTAGRSQSEEHWIPSPLLPVWRSQRIKQSRLWKKVLMQQCRPAAERTAFTQRLRSTFPSEWPSGCPADIRRELELLTQRCLDLTHLFHAELQTQQSDTSWSAGSETAGSETGERVYESSLMLEGLERMTEDLLTRADQQVKDWKRWNSCHSEILCPVRKRGEWSDPDCSGLPPVLSYSTETQLRELERQRLHVEHLQQAVRLQQVMSDHLASCWTVTGSGPDVSAAVLRGLYSLLAEGGLQVPSLVLDSE